MSEKYLHKTKHSTQVCLIANEDNCKRARRKTNLQGRVLEHTRQCPQSDPAEGIRVDR